MRSASGGYLTFQTPGGGGDIVAYAYDNSSYYVETTTNSGNGAGNLLAEIEWDGTGNVSYRLKQVGDPSWTTEIDGTYTTTDFDNMEVYASYQDFSGDMDIDRIELVPEPMTLGILVVGGLLAFARKFARPKRR